MFTASKLSLSLYKYNLVTCSSLTSSCHPTLMEDKRRIWFCSFSLDRNFLDTLFLSCCCCCTTTLNNQLISHLINRLFLFIPKWALETDRLHINLYLFFFSLIFLLVTFWSVADKIFLSFLFVCTSLYTCMGI